MRRKLTSIVVCVILASSLAPGTACNRKVQTDPARLQQKIAEIQAAAERMDAYANIGASATDSLLATGAFKGAPEVEEAIRLARTGFTEFRSAAGPFLELTRTLTSLDLNSQAGLDQAFDAVQKALRDLKPTITRLVDLVAGYLKEKGIASVDIEKLRSNVELALSIVDAAVVLMKGRFRA